MQAMATTTATATPSEVFRVMVRGALVPSVVSGVLTALVFLLLRDLGSGLSGLFGVVVATVFFASGFLLMARMVREASPMLFMAAALSVYMGQMIVLFLVFMGSRSITGLDGVAVGVTILVVAIVWQVASMVAWRRARSHVYDAPGASGTVTPGAQGYAPTGRRGTTTDEGRSSSTTSNQTKERL